MAKIQKKKKNFKRYFFVEHAPCKILIITSSLIDNNENGYNNNKNIAE